MIFCNVVAVLPQSTELAHAGMEVPQLVWKYGTEWNAQVWMFHSWYGSMEWKGMLRYGSSTVEKLRL